jgi:electron transfer flavoprotein beta subunit
MLAERLGLPQVTFASKLAVTGTEATAVRDTDAASDTIVASLPAIVSVTDQSGEARYPSFKGIMAAKKKKVATWGLADLDIDPSEVGLRAARSAVLSVTARPARQAGQLINDEGDGGRRLAEFLAAGKFV